MDIETTILIIQKLFYLFEYLLQVLEYRLFGLGDMVERDISGKVAIVTGGNTGIGKQVVKELADRGATVILACRNLISGKQAVDDIKSTIAFAKVELMHLDLEELQSIRKFASDIKSLYPEIHLLINNAGVCSYSRELQKSKEGFELHMGVNHIGHFLLTNLLLDNIKAGAPSRIVTISSSTLMGADLKCDDLMMKNFANPTDLSGIAKFPYKNSKLANALFAKELGRRLKGSGVTTYSLCPGLVETDIFRDCDEMHTIIGKVLLAVAGVSVEKATLGILYCALSRRCENETGNFYRFGQIYQRANALLKVHDGEELWTESEKYIN